MYVPAHAREERIDVLARAIDDIGFGTLVTVANGRALLTHLPMMLRGDDAQRTIVGHVSKANEQWRCEAGTHAVAAFVGPNFYVSPSAYATKALTGTVVPTWNYIAVEARGSISFFDDPSRLHALVAQLTDHHEAPRADPWDVADAPADFIDAQLRGIVGFELRVEEMIGAWKLSRNRSDADRDGVARCMQDGADPIVASLAATVRKGTDRAREGP